MKTFLRRIGVPMLATVSLVACGGTTSTGTGTGPSDGGAGSDAPTALGDASSTAASCPPTPPSANESCARRGLVCEFGDDPRASCHTLATCGDAGKWEVTSPKCQALPTVKCPASRQAAQGQSCTPESAICVYEDGLQCNCTTCPNPYPICQPLPAAQWACQAPNADPACAPARPKLGTPCAKAGQLCSYGCERENNLLCVQGVWSRDPSPTIGCPASTRRAKKDIRYLSPSEAQALAAEVQNIRLATYEYTDPALSGSRKLGFILEDHATTFAGDAEKNQVDLYAYASTLVAAIQEQAKELDALKREVAHLRASQARSGVRK